MKSTAISDTKSAQPPQSAAWLAHPVNFDTFGRDLRHMIDQINSSLWSNPFYPAALLGNGNGLHQNGLLPFPEINLTETDKAVEITAEVPGMKEEEIDLVLANGCLTLKGSKLEETDKSETDFHLSERRFGSFERTLMVPEGIDTNAISATLAQGVLTITLPKTKEAQSNQKKIAISGEKAKAKPSEAKPSETKPSETKSSETKTG